MPDVPVAYRDYAPENYDGEYSGRVTAREALRRSLNAPAVRLLARAGANLEARDEDRQTPPHPYSNEPAPNTVPDSSKT